MLLHRVLIIFFWRDKQPRCLSEKKSSLRYLARGGRAHTRVCYVTVSVGGTYPFGRRKRIIDITRAG